MENKEEVKKLIEELSIKMLKNENTKLQLENIFYFDKKNCTPLLFIGKEEQFEKSILEADEIGFELSLAYNELLFQNGMRHNFFKNGNDAANIWCENYLYKHDLKYPISWYIDYEDRDGLHFGYYSMDGIEALHKEFLSRVNRIKMTDLERKRILGIAEYYKKHRQLVSKYFGDHSYTKEKNK